MKTLTGKERAKVYRKAAEKILEHPGYYMGGCDAIGEFGGKASSEEEFSLCFPEFYSFRPEVEEGEFGLWWWANSEKGKQCRINALLLSAQIALDSKN